MSKVGSTTVGVLVGGAVGAATALLLAPKRGEEARSDVMTWMRSAEHKAADKIRAAGSVAASGIRQVPGMVAKKAPEVGAKLISLFHRGREMSEQAAQQAEQKSERAARRLDQQAEQM